MAKSTCFTSTSGAELKRIQCKQFTRGESISAVLVSYNRARECQLIAEHLIKTELFSEVLIWLNHASDNRMAYGRYLAALEARSRIVYTQDDDCIVKNIRPVRR
jgi:hypothetical protein